MNDTQSQDVNIYVGQVIQRFNAIIELILFLPSSTPCFFPDDIIDRMPDVDREKLSRLLEDAKALRENVSQCEDTIKTRQGEAIQRAGDVETGKDVPAEAMPLYLIVHGLFDETIRLSALAMQSISLSKDIARLLENASTPEEATKGNNEIAERLASIEALLHNNATATAEKLDNLQGVVEDRNRHRWEKWATVPDCVRAVLEAVEIENNDGKALSKPGSVETLRIKIQDELKSRQGKRAKETKAGIFYPIVDIAEAMSKHYTALTTAQYIREFEPFACQENDLHRATKRK